MLFVRPTRGHGGPNGVKDDFMYSSVNDNYLVRCKIFEITFFMLLVN